MIYMRMALAAVAADNYFGPLDDILVHPSIAPAV